MKFAKALILIGFAALMIFASMDLPYRGGEDLAMNRETSITGTEVAGSYYIRNAYTQAKTPNIVTVVLGDYRSLDTLGEQTVVFTAGLILMLLLGNGLVHRRRDEAASGGSTTKGGES